MKILHIGNLKSGIDTYVRNTVAWASDNFEFVIVNGADDNSEPYIRDGKPLPVDLVGFQKEPMKFLKKAVIYLSTSRFEGLPYALIEAASVGLPLVATDVKGNNEVAINGENGITYKTAEEGAAALRRILGHKLVYDKMSSKSRKIFEDKFTVKVMIEDLMKLYKSLN